MRRFWKIRLRAYSPFPATLFQATPREILVNKELLTWLSRLDQKAVDVLVIIDSCFHGGMARSVGAAKPDAGRICQIGPCLSLTTTTPSWIQCSHFGERDGGLMVAILSDKPLTSLDLPAAPRTFRSKSEAMSVIALRKELTPISPPKPGRAGEACKNRTWAVDMYKYAVK